MDEVKVSIHIQYKMIVSTNKMSSIFISGKPPSRIRVLGQIACLDIGHALVRVGENCHVTDETHTSTAGTRMLRSNCDRSGSGG
jgi:hypothetical protein